MKKRLTFLSLCFSLIWTLTACQSAVHKKEEGQFTVLTSFYPMYIITSNLTQGASNVDLRNLASPSVGCLHDYQMRPTDMANMEQSDVLIINGGGMETFLDDARKGIPDLHVIDATEGIELFSEEEEDALLEEEHDHDHDHGIVNSHAWLSLERYRKQIQIVADGLARANPENKAIYEQNAKSYLERLEELERLEASIREKTEGKKIVIFHEAFAYLAEDLGMEVVQSLEVESDAGLSAGQIRELIDTVKQSGAEILLSEKQYSGNIGRILSEETGIQDITLDSCVSGEMNPNEYILAMEQNLRLLKEVLEDEPELWLPLH